MIGAISVVIAHIAIAAGAFSFGKIRSNSVCVSGIIGPPHRPCRMRPATSIPSEVDSPHRIELSPNKTIDVVNTRTEPKRAASQPVSGTVIASATA